MSKTPTRRAFLLSAAALSALPTAALPDAPATSLRPVPRPAAITPAAAPSVATLVARSGFQGTLTFAVADMRTGQQVEAMGSGQGLPPASVAKALTAAYALDRLGPGHRFVTRLLATGPVQGGVLQGDLVLAGGGDPTLDTDRLAALAADLRAAGVTRVSGRFLVTTGGLGQQRVIDRMQPDHVGYNPSVGGLNLNFNRVHFEWRRSGDGYELSMDARSANHRPRVDMARMALSARPGPVYEYRLVDGRDEWTVARGALGRDGSRWLPVRDPARYAGEAFQALAKAQGVTLGAPVTEATAPQGTEIARDESGPLRVILRDMMRWSTNLTAEVVGMAATRAGTGRAPSDVAASAGAMNRWARQTLGLRGIALVDHSGLGDGSRISAGEMVQALAQLRRRRGIKALMKTVPLRDERGRTLPDHPITVQAKTGTLHFVSALAGFADLPGGGELVFAILTADLDRRNTLSRAERERPEGARSWAARSRRLQSALIERWGVLHAG